MTTQAARNADILRRLAAGESLEAIAQWLDGRANDHMTVLRLRRLTEGPA